jgi:quinol monooxygenase YgiN
MSKLAMIVKTKTKPGKRDEVQRLFDEHLRPHALEPDSPQNLVVSCFDDHDPDTLVLFEIYRDHDAPQQNAQAPWFWAYMKAIEHLIEGRPEVWMGTPVWAKGVDL